MEDLKIAINAEYRRVLMPVVKGEAEAWIKKWEDTRAKIDTRYSGTPESSLLA
jgi:hypothetical protein